MSRRGIVLGGILIAAALLGHAAAARLVAARSARTRHPVSGAPLVVPGQDGNATLLFNGWRISPAGRPLPTGDMLLGGALSPDGRTLAIANCGFSAHALHLVDLATEREIATLKVARAWFGVAWAPSGERVYLSGGVSNPLADVHVFDRGADGAWAPGSRLRLGGSDPKKTCVAGLAVSADGRTLFAANVADGHLYALDTATGETRGRAQVGDHPGALCLSADGTRLYVANWGGSEVAVVDVTDAARPVVASRLSTGAHPNGLALGTDGRLYVSCGNADEVRIYDTRDGAALETVRTSLTPKAALGATPNAVAVTADNRTLYAANADNNDVCVVDVSQRGKSRVRGFIPTGWYPTAVIASRDGSKVIIGSGKGTGSRPNPARTPIDPVVPAGFPYIATQLNGSLAFVDTPSDARLAEYTRQVWANTPYSDAQLRAAQSAARTAIPTRVGGRSPIRYVLYIIKENRTYDQVYGDMPKGNGDPALCLFGRDVTPNQHALADEFVLLDNLYCNGEVSADGHPWSTSAYCTDYNQRAWTLSYSGHGGLPDGDGVYVPGAGYLWDACKRKGLTYRSYGEYVHATSSAAAPEQRVAGAKGLIGHGSPAYVGIGRRGGMRDTDKADVFIEEFKEFERTKTIPQFMVMSLGENHTQGTRAGAHTPKACVASNDVAVGRIVDAISHSSAWAQTAIFIIEDDAQNGPDHVDSHRTAGLVISPYVRRGAVDSTMYTTTSMVRTMELILGLPPLTQYDAAATPMFASFTDRPDLRPFNALEARVDLNAKNSPLAYGAAESGRMDWSAYDRIDEDTLNRILWHNERGRNVPMPAPVRRALLGPTGRLHAARQAADD